MIKLFQKTFLLCCLGVYLFLAGCSSHDAAFVLETEEKHYQRGQRMLKEGRYSDALEAFLKVAEKRRDAPESHLEVGRLYLQNLNDPISAIYHFRKYLEYKPDAQQAYIVRQLIETAKKDFIRQLPGQPSYGSDAETLDFMSALKQLKKENLELKRELSTIRSQTQTASPAAPAQALTSTAFVRYETASTPAASRQRSYVVESGDSLSRISQKVYGTTARWEDIYLANKGVLPSPHSLKVGQELVVPQ